MAMKRMVAAAGASLLLVLGGCGGDDDKVTEATSGAGDAAGGTSLAGSDDAGRNDTPDTPMGDAMPGSDTPEEPTAEMVKPRPGMENKRPVTWDKAEALSERKVLVTFYGGVEPCDVLDSVKVSYGAKAITISLFSGSDPKKPDAVCIEIAQLKQVEVDLTEDVDGRAFKDGAPDATTGQAHPGMVDDGATAGGSDAPAGKIRGDAQAVALTPKAGQENLRKVTFTDVKNVDANTLRINFTSGVEPCDVLDHVEVVETGKSVTITLWMGNAPGDGDTACPALARFVYTDVDLDSALGDREIVDGAAG